MPCTCKRFTFRYACRHKEREFDRCWRYQFKKDFPCLGGVVSKCESQPTRIPVSRVCSKCFEFFLHAFGRKAAYHVSKRFLEFKGNNGLSKEVLDPSKVPLEAYISSAELATLDSTVVYRGGQSSGQPFRPRSPMRAIRSHNLPSPDIQQPEPVIYRNRHGDRSKSRSKSRSKPRKSSKRNPIPRKPVPTQGKISKRNISQPTIHRPLPDMNPMPSGNSDFESFPAIPNDAVVEHGTNQTIDLSDLVDNERDDHLDHDTVNHGRVSNRNFDQELLLRLTQVSEEPRPKPSNGSLAKKITKMANTTKIMGCLNPDQKDLPSVPTLEKAPKVPTWRIETPSPEPSIVSTDSKGKIKQGRSKSAQPLSRKRDLSPLPMMPVPATATATTYMFRARASSESLKGDVDASLRDTLQIPPPPNTANLKSFREKGIPSAAVMFEGNTGEKVKTVEKSPAILVSVSTPSPAYSCAVQSCYCSEGDNAQTCPSCLERKRLEPELQSKWV
ncbi:uncharacterized protein GGS22DRAFT_195110 [Annulohypoxylon maeteangense]|uniref:uncharacterized protein n=1 Tax=Annulohypoxylon maeteangense TaxID=1927788 RepID=UPI002008AEC9|nr:uncharacterized protein GGS22DRAFT_195110 [Annulohypoxylon maeteangense]KAI0883977.1 hypothetical protein GGS22DRAFT_195110 [Annulohypoxylon maeteangense]